MQSKRLLSARVIGLFNVNTAEVGFDITIQSSLSAHFFARLEMPARCGWYPSNGLVFSVAYSSMIGEGID